MANFTEDIKVELCSKKFETHGEKLAAFAAFLRTSGSIVSSGDFYGFEIVTESETSASLFEEILTDDFGLTLSSDTKSDVFSGKDKYTYLCIGSDSDIFLRSLDFIGEDSDGKFISYSISDKLVASKKNAIAFIKGAFLGGGSCTIPELSSYSSTGYHLEFIFSHKTVGQEFCAILAGMDIFAKLVSRKDNVVIYVKSKDVIADILNLIGATDCLKKLEEIIREKDITNNTNRAANCSVSNIDKTITASISQIHAIEIIRDTIGLKSLDENLFEVVEARLADKNASLCVLANRLNITKSCINHRMRKIIALAKELED